MAKKLNVIGATDNIFRTFNDYSDNPAINLTEIRLPKGHPWIDKTLKDIIIPNGMMAVMIIRDGKTLIPRGDSMVLADDSIILNTPVYTDHSMKLREVQIGPYHPWVNQKISELTLPSDTLIFLIQRAGKSLIPDGQTSLQDGDCLILNA